LLEFSRDNTTREKHSNYEQPQFSSELDDLNYVISKVFGVLSSGCLQLYQVIDPELCELDYKSFSIYAAENIDQARSYVQHHLSGVDLYTQEEIQRSLETIRPFDLSKQTLVNLEFFLDLYYIVFDNDCPAYVGEITL